MKIWHLAYAALGIAVARWVFKRQSIAGKRSDYPFPYLWPAIRTNGERAGRVPLRALRSERASARSHLRPF